MQITLIQAVLIGFVYYLTNNGTPLLTGLGSISLRQPIVSGTVVGFILGNPVQGCIIGATINTLYLGFINAGGTLPTDPGVGGVVGTALALSSGASPEVAMTIAVPVGLMGAMVWNLRQTLNSVFVQRMDKYAEVGDTRKMAFWQTVPAQLLAIAVTVIPCALLVYFGADQAKNVIDSLSGTPLHILSVIGGILPAIGIAMILKMLNTRNGILLLFVFGFFLRTYSGLSMLAVAIFALVFGYFYSEVLFKKEEKK